MVQQIQSNQPQYVCMIPIESLTGNQEEEIMTFGGSVNEVQKKAEQLLTSTYGCNYLQIEELMQQAKIELITPWCTPIKAQEDKPR
ncbi:hypothetical protein H6G41_14540 [Tolypothrix sp. FACHB-123]|uniref:hypothetical protein n=1 Tax=Tolypothrix sp. FACHB-123 TaxID=2692868 RepID=UPI001687015F|nr:hypothetical protein [Tolypothrix sp. FACHB-123]MBD2355822.1 hypothetical protein [Tolypothrix sp. FACHB-123]